MTAEEQTGEIINDSVYIRNTAVEDRYNIKICKTPAGSDAFKAQLPKMINSNTADFDVALYRMADMVSYVGNGYFRNIFDLEYTDFTKPWWEKESINYLSLDHKLFGIHSAITLVDKMGAQALVFNKDILQNYSLETPYQSVSDGTWTIDKLGEMTKQVSKDLNGDGKMDTEDLWGLFYQRDTLSNFVNGCGVFMAQKNAEDYLEMTFAGERQYAVYEKIFDVLYDDKSAINAHKDMGDDWAAKQDAMFQQNQGLFMWIRMRDCEALRSMETDFGIVPPPKYDVKQDRYYVSINPYTTTILGIPVSNTDMEKTGIILEALAAESLYTVQPAYYDITLQGKVTRDVESEQMLDIIYGNLCYDIGDMFCLGGLEQYVWLTMTKSREIASYYEKREGKCLNDIEKIMAKIAELNQ